MENEIFEKENKKKKFNLKEAVYQDLMNNKKKEEDLIARLNFIKNFEKVSSKNSTNFPNNTAESYEYEINRNIEKSNNELESNTNLVSIKKGNVIHHDQEINFLLNTNEKKNYYINNIPENFYFKINDSLNTNNEIEIKQFNLFYHKICQFMANFVKNFNFSILDNTEKYFLCEFKIYSQIKNENYLQFQIGFYKSVEIEYFDYIPLSNTIQADSIFSKELEIFKEDAEKFFEKIIFFKLNN